MGRSSDLRRTRNSVHFISESRLAIMVDLTPESANVPMVWYPKNCPICDDPEDECYYRVPRRAWCHEAMMMIMMIMAGMAAEHGGPDPGGLQRLQRVQTSL